MILLADDRAALVWSEPPIDPNRASGARLILRDPATSAPLPPGEPPRRRVNVTTLKSHAPREGDVGTILFTAQRLAADALGELLLPSDLDRFGLEGRALMVFPPPAGAALRRQDEGDVIGLVVEIGGPDRVAPVAVSLLHFPDAMNWASAENIR